ncbi:MAG: diguanylate cyclase, partial [Thalassolituus sp.]
SDLASSISSMAEKLCHCPLPKPMILSIRELRKQAPKALDNWEGYAAQLQGWSDILRQLADIGNQGGEATNGGWWNKFFGKDADSATAHSGTPEPQTEVAPVAQTDSADADKTEPGFSRISEEVADTLSGLIARLVVPERLQQRSQELQQRVSNGLHWYEFVAALEDTSQFLLDCLGSGQEEFERFLQSLDKRLQAIQVMVADANSSQGDREQARDDLETMVRDQIADIRSVVNGLGDLGELGTNVLDHLTTIVKAMEHYQQIETQREERLAEQLQVLKTRLSEMEAEASQARKIIEDQKTRATLDHLTGLPNRAAYEVRLSEELLQRTRGRNSLSIIVCDVDHFKKINDTYGHIAGDKVLQLLSATLRKHLRQNDFIARYGGEEFVVLLPSTDCNEAAEIAELLRSKVEACPFNFRGQRVTITMSFGVSEFRALEAPETVFERTDKALYKAKESGRNRVVKA